MSNERFQSIMARLLGLLYALAICSVVIAITSFTVGCAHYKAEIHPDGSGKVNIWSTREFPEGMKTSYKDFHFEANSVQGGITIQDVINMAEYLKSAGVPIPEKEQ